MYKRLMNGLFLACGALVAWRIAKLVALSAYSKTTFVNNSAPGIDSGWLNGIQAYLAPGTANCGVPICSKFSGTGSGAAQTVSHNLHDQNNTSITPDVVVIQPAGNFGGPPSAVSYYFNTTSTQVTVVVPNGISYNAVALKF